MWNNNNNNNDGKKKKKTDIYKRHPVYAFIIRKSESVATTVTDVSIHDVRVYYIMYSWVAHGEISFGRLRRSAFYF